MSDIFDLLDDSLDSLADLEKFEAFHAGTHTFDIAFEEKEMDGLPCVDLKLVLVESIELADPSQAVQEPGKKGGILFMLKKKDKQSGEVGPNTIGQGQLKEVLKVLHETFGGASMRETMSNAAGARVTATLKTRSDKNDTDKKYNSIKALLVG